MTGRRSLAPGLLVLALALTPQAAGAQTVTLNEPWRWSRFGVESGLPDDVILALTETESGQPWVATQTGLAWFDGFRWRRVGPVTAGVDSAALDHQGERVLAVLEGRLFVGDSTEVSFRPLVVDGVPLTVLGAVWEQPGAILLVAHQPSQPVPQVYRLARGRVVRVPLLPDVEVTTAPALRRTRMGDIWLTSSDGILVRRHDAWARVPRTPPAPSVGPLVQFSDGRYLTYLTDPASHRGLWEFGPAGRSRRFVGEGLNPAVALAVGPRGEVLAAYETGDLRQLVEGRWRPVTPLQPGTRDIRTLSFRRDGDLWIGTSYGLFLYRASARLWSERSRPFPDLHNRVNALLRTRDGTLWLGTGRGLLLQPAGGPEEAIEEIQGQTLGPITALREDPAGRIWVGSGSAFAGAFVREGGRWRRYGPAEGFDFYIHDMYTDRQGRLWFLTSGGPQGGHGQGALVLEGDRPVPWSAGAGQPGAARTYAMLHAADGALWFGTGDGLLRWRNGSWTAWRTGAWFRGRGVYSVAEGPDGTVWATDRASGVLAIGPGREVRRITTAEGLIDNRVWDLEFDAQGRLWIATSGGLGLRRPEGTLVALGVELGLPGLFFWPLLPEPDRLLIGSRGSGLITLYLDEAAWPPPQVRLERPAVTGNDVLLRWAATAHWGHQAPGRIPTRVRLDGGRWSRWGVNREAELRDLAAGLHRVEIQARNLFGQVPDAPARIEFTIPPPLPLQPHVVLLLSLLGLVLGGTMVYAVAHARRTRRERQALTERLRHAQKMQALGLLAGGIAHDFNNILTAVVGGVDVAELSLPPHAAQAREDLDHVRAAARRGAAMVRKLTVFARGTPLDLGAVDLAAVVRDLGNLLARLLPESVRVELRIEESVPVLADRGALEQIVLNLATNARDAMPEGGTLTLRVMAEQIRASTRTGMSPTVSGYGCLVVRDTGTGMDEATLNRIFEPFFTTKPQDKGTGLGMAMVYGMVQQQGGIVQVESAPGRGTTVWVRLPLASAEDPGPEGAEPATAARGGETILLVEDNQEIRSTVSRLLLAQGYLVTSAPDGQEAWEFLRTTDHQPDLVISDVIMPVLGGVALYQRARDAGYTMPFIFVSGHAGSEAGQLPRGAPLLGKPFELVHLLHEIRRQLDAPRPVGAD